ncbi:hypothetical protein [Halomarina oriensis]|uniref:VOC domain-containing protein n=1 Tax=Halomarina oriensis TaxID=671145 RepID=A0A6B0GPT0_9EURY|nr:hypothetical protein [Halomarina oriensis]MWG33648.1 hypothetical protein [Halomarina oriensis]
MGTDVSDLDPVALVVGHDVETVRARLDEAGIAVERELDAPTGATGVTPAVYVRDPLGYRVELKSATGHADARHGLTLLSTDLYSREIFR